MDAGIRFGELLEYEGRETKRWKEGFVAHPEALERPCNIASGGWRRDGSGWRTLRCLRVRVFSPSLRFQAGNSRPELACGEELQCAEAAGEFAAGETALAIEPAEKILGTTVAL